MLTEMRKSDIIAPVQNGWICCPDCGSWKKLLRVDEDTEARALPIYCNRCKQEFKINIRSSRALEPEPD